MEEHPGNARCSQRLEKARQQILHSDLFLEKTTTTLGERRRPETQREVDSDTQRKRGRDSERKGDIMGSG